MKKYKTIIFDIGNVLYNIDYTLTIKAFSQYSKLNIEDYLSFHKQIALFDKLDRGEVSDNEFLTELEQKLFKGVSHESLVSCWNQLLIGMPDYKITLLKRLKESYRVLALSNINFFHIRELDARIQKQAGLSSFAELFHKAYYSCEMGTRKPEREIYEIVQHQEKFTPSEVLFIDDKQENVDQALSLGWHSIVLKNPENLVDLLNGEGVDC